MKIVHKLAKHSPDLACAFLAMLSYKAALGHQYLIILSIRYGANWVGWLNPMDHMLLVSNS
eukprot:scaffold637814_cov47-Prasinocladus_malaysianus.AAC.1